MKLASILAVLGAALALIILIGMPVGVLVAIVRTLRTPRYEPRGTE
jgi:hypothetical protein